MRIQPGTGLCNPCRSLIAFRALPVPSNTGRSTLLQPRHVKARVQQLHLCAKPGNEETVGEDDGSEGLLPEEDWTVPGGYQDSLSSNTELGRAVQDACTELDNLSSLEKESLTKASELLQKLGYKGSIFQNDSLPDDSEQSKQG